CVGTLPAFPTAPPYPPPPDGRPVPPRTTPTGLEARRPRLAAPVATPRSRAIQRPVLLKRLLWKCYWVPGEDADRQAFHAHRRWCSSPRDRRFHWPPDE